MFIVPNYMVGAQYILKSGFVECVAKKTGLYDKELFYKIWIVF